MRTKKKRLMFLMFCDKCNKEPIKEKKNDCCVINLDCSCGERIVTDYTKPYYE